MNRYDISLIGFGGVNRALAELIVQRGDDLAVELRFTLRVVAITDLRAGSLVDLDGVDLAPLLSTEPGALSFASLPGGSADPRNEWVIRDVPADIVSRRRSRTPPTVNRPGESTTRSRSVACRDRTSVRLTDVTNTRQCPSGSQRRGSRHFRSELSTRMMPHPSRVPARRSRSLVDVWR